MGASGCYELWCALDDENELFQAVEVRFNTRLEALGAAQSLAHAMGIADIYVASD